MSGENQETTAETSQEETVMNIASGTMTQDLRNVMLEVFKDRKKSWQEMTKQEQGATADRIEHACERAAHRAVDIIAANGRPHIKAVLQQVTIKDKIKGVFELAKTHELRHDLTDAQGDYVLIVMPNTEEMLGDPEPAETDEDQPQLPLGEGENASNETIDPETGEVAGSDDADGSDDEEDDGEESDEGDDDAEAGERNDDGERYT